MDIVFILARCGFSLQINRPDFTSMETIIFRLMLFWRRAVPVCTWSIHRGPENGRVFFERYRKGKWTGYKLQGPIQRVERAF